MALIPPLASSGLPGVLAGAPLSHPRGALRAGGARLHVYDPSAEAPGLQSAAYLALGGETDATESYLGNWLTTGVVGDTLYAVVGGYRGSSLGIETGSVYVVPLGELAE